MYMDWVKLLSDKRLKRNETPEQESARTAFQRDYDRLIFSEAFRRLVDKTQVFPLPEDDHIHSRMTHSLEAACVGRSLGNLAGQYVIENYNYHDIDCRSFGDIVAAACLAHDIGNPPFGHSGENAIREWVKRQKCTRFKNIDADSWQEFKNFEGNAQGFRVLVRHQRNGAGGLRLTCATLATFMKYPCLADEDYKYKEHYKKYGIFHADREYFEEVANETGLLCLSNGVWARHPLAYLVEAADDICYHVVDVEDGYRLGYLDYEEAKQALVDIAQKGDVVDDIGLLRAYAINKLIYSAHKRFIEIEDKILRGALEQPLMKTCDLNEPFERLKGIANQKCYQEPDVVAVELTGFKVLGQLLDIFVDALFKGREEEDSSYTKKIGQVFPKVSHSQSDYETLLNIMGFVSGMTDSYAVKVYRRILGMELPPGQRALT